MTNKDIVTGWLENTLHGSTLDLALCVAGFARVDRVLCYERRFPEITQQFKIIIDVSPRYEPSAVAHVLPQAVFISPQIGEVVQKMTGGDPQLVGIGDIGMMFRHQLQNLAPKGDQRQRGSRWYIHGEADVASLLEDVGGFTADYALPFLNRYRDITSLTHGFEVGDERLRMDRRFYLYIAAAFVCANQPTQGLAVLKDIFGRPGPRKQYARAFDYLQCQCEPRYL